MLRGKFFFVVALSAMPRVAATMNSIRESSLLPSIPKDESSETTTSSKESLAVSLSQSFDDTKERSLQHSRVEIVRLTMFRTVCNGLLFGFTLSNFMYGN